VYSELKSQLVVETIGALQRRIAERFADSGLARVAGELYRLGQASDLTIARLRRPIWWLRLGAALGIAGMVAVAVVFAGYLIRTRAQMGGIVDLLQASEAAVNEIVLLGLAIFFMVSLETRVKRRQALQALHRLRNLVHIVDMHQLTKDPEYLVTPSADTASSPTRTLTRFELARYLDYCSELLSLASKVAALHGQYLNDPVVLGAVSDVETLAGSLSNKIWQKITILDTRPPAIATGGPT
jgi:hypothetical protein